jgi:hypothetical protein
MKIFYSALLLLSLTISTKAQTLLNPVFTSYPSYLGPGVSAGISTSVIPGATSYVWSTPNGGQVNGMLFNGLVSPVTTGSPYVVVTATLPECLYVICLQGFSACCSSAVVCVNVYSVDSLTFNPFNSTVAYPNSSGVYGINQPWPNNTASVYWTTTGDITINNSGNDSLNLSVQNSLSVNLNFGPTFSGGTVCVTSLNTFNMGCITNCMTINSPVGLLEPIINNQVFYNAQTDQLVLNTDEPGHLMLTSANGKSIINQEKLSGEIQIKLPGISNGIYFFKLITDGGVFSQKIIINK